MKKNILIGPLNKNNIGSIPILNRAFVDGLSSKYQFIPFSTHRKYGKSRQSNFNFINLLYLIKHYFLFLYLILKHRPSITHYPINSSWSLEKSLFFLTTAKLFGAKNTVGHLHGGSFEFFMSNIGDFRKKIALKLFSKVDTVIVASNYWKEYLKKIGVTTIVEVVNNPIDLSYVTMINNHKKTERNKRFLFVGSLGARKGVYDIIELSRSKNVEFILDAVGAEDRKNDLNKIRTLISENELSNKINIVISEKLNLLDKVEYFTKSGVFLFPTHHENFPLVIIEAACAGMPIITCPVGAIPEFFTHMENIYFVEPGNIEELRIAIDFMKNNTSERERLGKSARKVYEEKLSNDIIMSQLDEVYKELLK